MSCNGVHRRRESLFEHHGTLVGAFEIARLPRRLAGHRYGNRLIHHHIGRRLVQVFQHPIVKEWFETGSRLPVVLHRAVIWGLKEIPSAHQCLHRPGIYLHGDQCPLQPVVVFHPGLLGPVGHVHLGFQLGNPLLQRCFSLLLHAGVQGRVDPQAAMVDDFGAIGLFQRFHHRVQEIAVHPQRTALCTQVNRHGLGFYGLFATDHTGGYHSLQHHLLPGPGTFRVSKRVVPGGRFRQAG